MGRAFFEVGVIVQTQPSTINKLILRAIAQKIQPRLEQSIPGLTESIRRYIDQQIRKSKTYKSLLSQGEGKKSLRGQLGIINASPHLDNLITILNNTIEVQVIKPVASNNKLRGGYRIVAIPGDFSDVLNSTVGQYTTVKGALIEWLTWLLKEGKQVVISNYEAVFDVGSASRGRTHEGFLMQQLPGSGFVVPSQHAGTVSNNFVTRAINAAEQQLKNDIIKAIKRSLK